MMSSFRRFAKKNDLDELYAKHIVKNAMGVDWDNPRTPDQQKEDALKNIEKAEMEIARLQEYIKEQEDFLRGNAMGLGTGEEVLENYGFPGIR